jgi:LysR family glycine cleavage system transcriptional activator
MSNRLPPLNSLRVFEVAARLLSFKQAADELAVTPTAVSHQIRLLEEYLDLPLFRRMTRALELTPAGAAMLPLVREGFASLMAAVATVRRDAGGSIVNVCAPPSFATRWLVPRLGHFSRVHPDVELRLSSSLLAVDSREVDPGGRDRLGTGSNTTYDFVIRFGRGHYPGWQVERLFSPAYVPVCSPTLLTGEHPLRVPADLRRHVLIHDATVPDFDDRPGWAQWLELAGVGEYKEMSQGPRFADAVLAVEAAIAGHGVALAARPLVSADLVAGRLTMPFAQVIPSRYAYYATMPASAPSRPAVAALHAWLAHEAARERAAEAIADMPLGRKSGRVRRSGTA